MMFSTDMCLSNLANSRDRDIEEFFCYFSRGRTTGPFFFWNSVALAGGFPYQSSSDPGT
jgi:hypothetical protein